VTPFHSDLNQFSFKTTPLFDATNSIIQKRRFQPISGQKNQLIESGPGENFESGILKDPFDSDWPLMPPRPELNPISTNPFFEDGFEDEADEQNTVGLKQDLEIKI
jgi:hypothetical protein